mmetsp:Transcript_20725/g.63790  ORF Transcript_20725/g.63790 Transcript_20725/m.63790 type:complete len:144 (+) Transcript_20725:347-778(+)
MLRRLVALALAASAAAISITKAAPEGTYYGEDKFVGSKIGATVELKNATSLHVTLIGALHIDCDDEPYTYDSSKKEIVLADTGSDDCIAKHLAKDHAELTHMPYDGSHDTITLQVSVSLGKHRSMFDKTATQKFELKLKHTSS